MNSKIKLLETPSVRGDDLTIIAKLSTRNKPWAAPEKQWTATSMEKPIKSARVHAAAPPHHPSFTPQQNKKKSEQKQMMIIKQPKFNQLSQPLRPLDFMIKS